MLNLFMKTKHPALVHDKEDNKTAYQHYHAHGAKEQYSGYWRFGGLKEEHNGVIVVAGFILNLDMAKNDWMIVFSYAGEQK